MTRNIFSAWYCLGVLGLCLVTYFAIMPFVGPMRAQGAFGFMGLLGLLPFFWFMAFRKEFCDERDRNFMQRSLAVGMTNGFSAIMAINGVLIWKFSNMGIDGVPLRLLGTSMLCSVFIAALSSSVVLLLLYYKGETADKEHGF